MRRHRQRSASARYCLQSLSCAASRDRLLIALCLRFGVPQAEHAEQVQTAREDAREAATAEAIRERDAHVAAAVATAKKELEREKRAAVRETAAEAEKALRRVLEAAAVQQAKAVAAARESFEEELLREP